MQEVNLMLLQNQIISSLEKEVNLYIKTNGTIQINLI
jgi:hypothetical protein